MLIASGAALLVRSVANLYAIDPGFRTENVAVLDVVVPDSLRARRQQTIGELVAAMAELPGARSAAASHKIPLRGSGSSNGISVEGRPDLSETTTFFRLVTPGYFETLGIALKAGRTFDATDRGDGEAVTVINEALATKYFPGESPIGRRLGGGFGVPERVVGVVADAAEGDLTDAREPTRYSLYSQMPFVPGAQTLVVRTRGDAAGVLDAARKAIQRTAPGVALQEATTMDRVLDHAVGPARQVMSLLALLSALALVLGAVGIYGVMSHFAARRQRDWAIRVALGLPASRVVRHVTGQGAVLVLAGVALGAVGTVALARLLASFLFGVSAVDPVAFVAASAALLAVGLVAALLPARRAGTVNPAVILREQ
jgi:predicted permease